MKKTDELQYEELKAIGDSIQEGLDSLIRFEQALHEFDKRTLGLFITLVTREEKFSSTLALLTKLENLLKEQAG